MASPRNHSPLSAHPVSFMAFLRPSHLALLSISLVSCDRAAHSGAPSKPAAVERTTENLPAEISFNEHIQPILSEYCYHCHGPDSGTRMPKDAPLRLDRPEDAFALRDGKPPIIKGKPADSLIVHLIKSQDPEEIM